MRTLLRWSLSSLSITTPTPCKAEPSRCMALSLMDLVEILGIDDLEARLLDRQPQQSPAGRDDGRCRLRPHVALGHEAQPIGPQHLNPLYAGDRPEALGQCLPLRFDLDAEAAAEHL